MNKTNASKWIELGSAMLQGKTIQRMNRVEWVNVTDLNTISYDPESYRIKPEPKKQWYRVCLTTHGAMAASSDKQEKLIGNFPIFIRWLTDRIEYTLPEGDA